MTTTKSYVARADVEATTAYAQSACDSSRALFPYCMPNNFMPQLHQSSQQNTTFPEKSCFHLLTVISTNY